MPELRLPGRAASGGVAFGRVHLGAEAALACAAAAAAGVTLPEAIRATLDQLRVLQAGLDPQAADIVQFQIELLEDRELTAGAFAAMQAGAEPGAAFRQAMALHLRVYEEAPDEYFRARAADLRDLRDRVLDALSGARRHEKDAPAEGAILLAEDLAPTAFLDTDWTRVKGVVTRQGSPSSHVAMLARGRGIPFLVGLGRAAAAEEGTECILDADAGLLVLCPEAATTLHYRRKAAAAAERAADDAAGAAHAAVTRDGRRIRVYVNVDGPDGLRGVPREWFDGIGLARTELLLDTSSGVPDRETQAGCYRPPVRLVGGPPHHHQAARRRRGQAHSGLHAGQRDQSLPGNARRAPAAADTGRAAGRSWRPYSRRRAAPACEFWFPWWRFRRSWRRAAACSMTLLASAAPRLRRCVWA